MAKDIIKRAENGTYYFRANLGYNPATGKQIQKYKSGFKTKKEAKEEYSKLILSSAEELVADKESPTFKSFIEDIYLPWYKTQVKESTYKNRLKTVQKHFAFFYRKKVDEIEPIHVQAWQLKLATMYESFRECSAWRLTVQLSLDLPRRIHHEWSVILNPKRLK
jgi:hypothetical protein